MGKAESRGAESRGDAYAYDPAKLVIVDDPTHPLYQEARVKLPVSEELVASMMAHGWKGTITVRQNGSRNGKPVIEVVDGRQRVKAAREANRRLKAAKQPLLFVTVAFEKGNSDDAEATMNVLNYVRVEEGKDPLNMAKDVKRMLDRGRSEKQVQTMFGINTRQLRDYLGLLACSPKLQKAVEGSQVTLTVARTLAKLPEKDQDAKLSELESSGLVGKRVPAATKKIQEEVAQAEGKKIVRLRKASEVQVLLDCMLKSKRELNPAIIATLEWVLGKDKVLDRMIPSEVLPWGK